MDMDDFVFKCKKIKNKLMSYSTVLFFLGKITGKETKSHKIVNFMGYRLYWKTKKKKKKKNKKQYQKRK